MIRKRYLVVTGVIALVAAGGAYAFAEPASESPTGGDATAASAVRLPTGDVVSLSPNGSLTFDPARGRENVGLVTPRALDGSQDVVAIPSDVVGEVVSGEQDPRRYNVSELVRAGESDAAAAETLSDKKYDGPVPVGDQPDFDAAGAQKVTVTATDANGDAVGESGTGVYIDQKTGEAGFLEFDESGKATVSLPPATYNIATMAGDVLGAKTVEVADEAVKVKMDGTESQPVKYNVDQPAKLVEQSVGINLLREGEDPGGVEISAPAEVEVRVIPTGKGDENIGLEAKPLLKGTEGQKPQYNLAFAEEAGVPESPEFTAHDADLAEVTRHFDGIASKLPGQNCNSALREGGSAIAMCTFEETEVPGERTEYLTADPKVGWFANTDFFDEDSEELPGIAFESKESFEPGPVERSSAHAPLGMYLGAKGEKVLRRDGDQIAVELPYLENIQAEESVASYLGGEGKVTMTRDGEEVGRAALTEGEGKFRLPSEDAGRYTLKAQMSHDGKITPLGVKSSVAWEFDSEFTGESTPLPVSGVNFVPDGVSNGYAEAGGEQEFKLDYVAQDGAADTALKDLSFEVSYDDGDSWDKVDVAVDGDSAAGALQHPKDAKFVSVKATATDSDGNKVTQSTLRAIGLK